MAVVDFQAKIETLTEELERERAELKELEQQWSQSNVQTERTRKALDLLRQVLDGHIPVETSEPAARAPQVSTIKALDVNEDTGRPARGARREQIELICRRIGRGGKTFRTLDVLNALAEIEDELTEGMKSYAYAVLTTLEKDNVLRKVKRGTWEMV